MKTDAGSGFAPLDPLRVRYNNGLWKTFLHAAQKCHQGKCAQAEAEGAMEEKCQPIMRGRME